MGYGPVVVAEAEDLELEACDTALVTVSDLDDGRVMLTANAGSDLVAAVSEIRRLCWPGWGYEYASDSMAGSLYFEGGWSPRSLTGLVNIERFIRSEIFELLAEVAQGMRTDSVVAPNTGLLATSTGASDDQLRDAQRIVAAWRRGATAATPPEHLSADGFVHCDLDVTDDGILIRPGACSAGAVAVLEKCFNQWQRSFESEPLGSILWQ